MGFSNGISQPLRLDPAGDDITERSRQARIDENARQVLERLLEDKGLVISATIDMLCGIGNDEFETCLYETLMRTPTLQVKLEEYFLPAALDKAKRIS